MHLYIDVYVPFIMLWRQKASSARSQEDAGNKAAALGGTRCPSEYTMETAGQETLWDMDPNRAATTKIQHPLAARASQQIMLSQRSFPLPHRKVCSRNTLL